MSKRSVFTTVTALPSYITRQMVLDLLHNHVEMIDLNPLVESRELCKPPAKATAEEYHCEWYQLVDRVSYLPGHLYDGTVTYHACFHDLTDGIQTHSLAPAGVDIKGKWTVGGSPPGETRDPTENGLGLPKEGLWLREDVDLRCNFLLQGFVKKNLKKAHGVLVDRLIEKTHPGEGKAAGKSTDNNASSVSSPTTGAATSHVNPTSHVGSSGNVTVQRHGNSWEIAELDSTTPSTNEAVEMDAASRGASASGR